MSSRGKGDSRGHESQKLPDGLRPLGKKGPEHKTGMLTSRKFSQTPAIGFCDHPPSEGLRSLKPARPLKQESGYSGRLKQESGYSDRVAAKARVWV